jgi:hypothetical protein
MTDYLVSSTGHLTDPPVQNRFRLRALAHVRPDECKWAVLEDPKQIGTIYSVAYPPTAIRLTAMRIIKWRSQSRRSASLITEWHYRGTAELHPILEWSKPILHCV